VENAAVDDHDTAEPTASTCFAEALASFEEAVSHAPLHGPAWAGRSIALGRMGLADEAVECGEVAVSVAPEWVGSWVALGRALLLHERVGDARASMERALQVEDTDPDALALRALVLLEDGEDDAAAEAWDVAMRARIERLRWLLGDDWDGRFEEALEEVGDELAAAPEDADLLTRRGSILWSYGRCLDELASARQELAVRPADPMAWHELAGALFALARYEESADAARRCTELDPREDLGWSSLGLALCLLDRPGEALAAYERAREIDPGYSGYWQYCAEVLEELGREDEAQAAYATAMDLAADEDEDGEPET
jgi:tetratricopeptide (TPR) repeat protein